MTPPERSSLESRIVAVLDYEAKVTMSLTDTPRELERFKAGLRHRARARVLSAAAAVLCLIAGTAATVALIGSTDSNQHPAPLLQPTTYKITKNYLGPATPLPATVPVTKLNGPENLGALAFGDLWATTGRDGVRVLPHATLYRISADGSQILSTATYPQVNDNQPDPVQVGNSIVVADRDGGYTVFGQTGQQIGSLSSTSTMGAVAGNSTGGWIATAPNEVGQVDGSGSRIDRTFRLPLHNISSLALSPTALWVTDEARGELLRVDPSTGAVTGKTHLTFPPLQVRYLNGAVYVTTTDDYGLHRIDPVTMKLVASTLGSGVGAYPLVAPSYNGQIWTQSLGGTLTQVDPKTLQTLHTTRVFPEFSFITNGAVIGTNRIYIVDGEVHRLYSYPTN
jgi:hypothetical protein